MADILIKGMEMPQTGNLVVCISSDGTVTVPYNYTLHFETPVPQTEAIELPEHGEAKDTDIAIRYIKSEMEDDFNETTTLDEKSYKEGMKRAIELIGYAPTVLEAST